MNLLTSSLSPRQRNKGTNLRIKLKLTIQEIATGVEKKIKVKRLADIFFTHSENKLHPSPKTGILGDQ